MKVIYNQESMRVPVKTWCAAMDDGTWDQTFNLSNHPVVYRHVALMPDAHSGYGMPIGGVIACENAVIPTAVGVDIGCGMCSIKTDIIADKVSKEDLRKIRLKIEKHIPVGEGNVHRGPQDWERFDDRFTHNESYPAWMGEDPDKKLKWYQRSLGTLGGGNHFIEVQSGDDNHLWVTLHSGSRNLGSTICNYYNKVAQDLNNLWRSEIPHKDLAFLPADSTIGMAYIRDMSFALEFAHENRKRMMRSVIDTLRGVFDGIDIIEEINIHHNYATLENHFGKNVWVHRKGATLAHIGVKGVIPGSMGTPTYIVEGLGNPQSFRSCSHGAGRAMGRMEACRTLTKEDCEKAMEGIEFAGYGTVKRKKQAMVDLGEAPGAYKDIDTVMKAQEDLVKVLVKLTPMMVVKG